MVCGEEKEMKRFITFEGIDGSGKSTVSKIVYEKLKKEGYNLELTFEPTDSWIGKIVQENIRSEADPFETAFTFIADRFDHCKKIQRWLDEDKIVICDRYAESTYAYQGAQMENMIGDPITWLKELSDDRILMPDKTFLFIIEPKDALARIQGRDELVPFEKVDFLTKVHKNYLKLAKGSRFLKLDATKSVEELVDICVSNIIS